MVYRYISYLSLELNLECVSVVSVVYLVWLVTGYRIATGYALVALDQEDLMAINTDALINGIIGSMMPKSEELTVVLSQIKTQTADLAVSLEMRKQDRILELATQINEIESGKSKLPPYALKALKESLERMSKVAVPA